MQRQKSVLQKICPLLFTFRTYPPNICYLLLTLFMTFEVAGFQSLSKWSLFWQDQAVTSMNGISQNRARVRTQVSRQRGGREDIFRTYNCNLICNLSAESCHVIARKLSATNASPRSCMPPCTCHRPPVLYYSPQCSTVQGCTVQYTLGEGRCCPDPEARTAPAQLTVSQ